jgi:hypothetical protein
VLEAVHNALQQEWCLKRQQPQQQQRRVGCCSFWTEVSYRAHCY